MLTLKELKEKRPAQITIDVPEWGGEIVLSRMAARSQLRMAVELDDVQGDDQDRVIATFQLLVVLSVIDADGKRILDSPDGRHFVERESFNIVSKIANECMVLHDYGNVYGEDEQKKTE